MQNDTADMTMPKPRIPPGSPDDTENSFYEALQHGDIERVMACWADDEDIVCVHPGGMRLVGHLAVRSAFEAILSGGGLHVMPESVRRLEMGGCGVHSVIERIETIEHDGPGVSWVQATNVYIKTSRGWRMVAHHASPGQASPPSTQPGSAPVLH